MKALQPKLPEMLTLQWRKAISTTCFSRYGINHDAFEYAVCKASKRALQRLVQALLRENIINPLLLKTLPDDQKSLTVDDRTCLTFERLISHRMSGWSLTGNTFFHLGEQPPQTVSSPSELLGLLIPLFAEVIPPETLDRLSEELDDSFINDTLCVVFHDSWSRHLADRYGGNDQPFLLGISREPTLNASALLEQWGTTGHPWHPNFKTKLGLSIEEVVGYSPEFEASFEISLCALHKDFAHIELMPEIPGYHANLDLWFPGVRQQLNTFLQRQGLQADDYIQLPVHPWQASETLPMLFANEIRDRVLLITDIKAFVGHPTMSFRTVLPEASTTAPMVKLPVGVRLTSVQRTVSPRSACMGPRVSALLSTILRQEPEIHQRLAIVPECIGIHFKSEKVPDERSRHLSVLFRNNPSEQIRSGEMAIPVGSLFAVDHNEQPLLRQWVSLSEGSDSAEAAQLFLDKYLDASLPGLLGMYVLYGIAFEAHQQNSFMVMDENGQPARLLLRDFGDIRIDRTALHGRGLNLLLQDPSMTLYDDPSHVRDKLLHTTFMCHFGELILLITRHWEISESALWETLHAHVSRCFENLQERSEPHRWRTEREALLEHDWPAKSFFRVRLHNSATDIVGRLKNPLNPALHAL